MPEPIKIIFVCWGNICRSPMAERVAERAAAEAGLNDIVFTSAATSAEELGKSMDRRAARVLAKHGYRAGDHVAHQLSIREAGDADLLIAMEDLHVRKINALLGSTPAPEIKLLSAFDPDAEPGSGVPDPWYGNESGFEDTLTMIQSAIPGVLEHVRSLQSVRD